MYKSICAVLATLLAISFAFANKFVNASPSTLVGPVIVAKVNLTNQTSTIPQTVIFTPKQTGLYRLSP
jgi:hypothetical protein